MNSYKPIKSNNKMQQQSQEQMYQGANLESKRMVYNSLIRLIELGKVKIEGENFDVELANKTNSIFEKVFKLEAKQSNIKLV